MHRPRVSIVIPTFNRAALLRECLHYALSVPPDSEIVIVDNASTDGTRDAVEEHAMRDGRIRYLRNETNIGMVPNFNRAMREARGDYLCVVCDDDLILPGHCEKKLAVLDGNPEIAFIYCPWHMIDADGRSSGTPLGSGMLTHPYVGGRDEFGDLIQNNHIMMNGVLFRRSMLEELGGLDDCPDIMPSPDWEMWLRYSHGRQTAYLPEPTCCVRFHQTSNTVENGTGQGAFAKARVNIWRRWLVERDPPIALNEYVWQRMRALWEQDLNYWFNRDQSQVAPYLEALERIKQENRALHERRFAAAVAASSEVTVPSSECPGEPERAVPDPAAPAVELELDVRNAEFGTRNLGSGDPTTQRPNDLPPIHWTANFFDYSGYARLARDAARALHGADVPFAIEPEGGSPRFMAELQKDADAFAWWKRLGQRSVAGGLSVYFGVPTWWDGTDAFARHRERHAGFAKHVGIAMFETDRLPAGWAEACNGMDEIWVPSEFNRETFASSGVDRSRLQVIPFGIDASAYDPVAVEPLPLAHGKGFTFLSVFQWSRRKGWDVLLDAYFRAFTARDDVCLVVRTYPDGPNAEPVHASIDTFITERGYDRAYLPAIHVLDEFISEAQMPRLYRAADCFVLPTRGEGWGIPYMEAMASALPVIATAWSAHLDFMNAETAYLVPAPNIATVDPEQTSRNPFYGHDHCWADPSPIETARSMRYVFENRSRAREQGRRARQLIATSWTLERTAAWIVARAEALAGVYGPIPEEVSNATPILPYSVHSANSAHSRTSVSSAYPGISWSAPLFDPSGYAEEARHFLLALDGAGVAVAAENIPWSNRSAVLTARDEQKLLTMTGRQHRADAVHVSHILAPHFTRRTDAILNVGRTMFETDRLPEGWADACNRMDRIWVPSEFNRRTFEFAGVDPERIAVVPGAIDPTPYNQGLPPLQIEGARGYNFLSVFDWSLRKGWDLLVRAFVEEFERCEDVALIIKTHSSLGYSTEQIVDQVAQFIRGELLRDPDEIPDIIFQDTDLSACQMPRLYLAADCFVLPTRGEGWGRPFMEAMTLGLPVIGTNWSGNTQFMNRENSLLLDCSVVPVPEAAWRETPTFRGHHWAEPDGAHLRRLMRQAFDDRDTAREIGARARDYILSHYSYCRVAPIILEEIAQARSVPTMCRAA